jgi:hypothetical protein
MFFFALVIFFAVLVGYCWVFCPMKEKMLEENRRIFKSKNPLHLSNP